MQFLERGMDQLLGNQSTNVFRLHINIISSPSLMSVNQNRNVIVHSINFDKVTAHKVNPAIETR